MPLFSKPQLEDSFRSRNPDLQKSSARAIREAAREILIGDLRKARQGDKFDIFLSHRYLDVNEVHLVAIKKEFESFGHTVFVDWLESPNLDRKKITPETAVYLRKVMNQSLCLFYVVSTNSKESGWIPWEVGYSDGRHGKVAIVPASEERQPTDIYEGREFFGLYPYVTEEEGRYRTLQSLCIRRPGGKPYSFKQWLNGRPDSGIYLPVDRKRNSASLQSSKPITANRLFVMLDKRG